ncbi:helix-turn-helix transcriptional regulator [Actinoplanes sp. ATCC 53533]|uniref:helix-turn-helix domain-containing protein n=1 Tax=Actinoplanes sp. ATCC 53533 TaxID=1288362 RepID=UPI001315A4B3|nr:helix-turn-helix transcriptional regulator [Actinoplanes sp. ATCC 53533]
MDREGLVRDAATVSSAEDLASLLRRLRRRQARMRKTRVATYRDLATRTGWSRGIIGAYFTGKVLPSVDKLDELARQLDATPTELGALATARDRVDELRPAPRQLPGDVPAFTGRAAALAVLDAQPGRGPAVISSVGGAAGMGKTALAVHWAHRAATRFPDGQLYADLRGSGRRPVPPGEVLRGFLTALGAPASQLSAGLDVQAGLYRSLLAERRVMVLLDDACDAGQVRPLLPGTPGGLALVTSRSRLNSLVALENARLIVLDRLDEAQSQHLLAARLGARRLAADPAGAAAIVSACAGLPNYLAYAAANAAAHPELGLRTVAGQLAASRPTAVERRHHAVPVQAF